MWSDKESVHIASKLKILCDSRKYQLEVYTNPLEHYWKFQEEQGVDLKSKNVSRKVLTRLPEGWGGGVV